MYLSRVLLDGKRRETMRALASPHVIHGALESSVYRDGTERGGPRKRLLWRVDHAASRHHLLLLSEERPNLTVMVRLFGYPDTQPQGETKEYDPLVEKLRNGQRWQFRLKANPVRSSAQETDESGRGKIFAHVTTEQQMQWLMTKADACGLSLKPGEYAVMDTDWKRFYKGSQGKHQVVLRTATYEGILTITDVDRFRRSLTGGIGRARAYGCGLITIMRITEA